MSLSIVQLYEVHFTFRVVRPQWTFSRRTVLHVTSPRDCVSSQCLSSENRVPFNTSTYHELPAVELRMFKQWAGCIFQKNTSYINAWMRHCKWPMLGSGSWGRAAIGALLDASAKLEALIKSCLTLIASNGLRSMTHVCDMCDQIRSSSEPRGQKSRRV